MLTLRRQMGINIDINMGSRPGADPAIREPRGINTHRPLVGLGKTMTFKKGPGLSNTTGHGATAFAALAALVIGAGFGAQAQAQNSATAAAADTGGLEEIVVTATRRSEELSKVPISVMAMSQDDMDVRGIKDFQDIARFTPGVSIDNSGTNAISIRGISSSGGAGTTGIYLDDTPIQMRAVGFNPDDTLPKTFDLDRVEVLRGPQGTLFGAGSEGGTVRYILTPASVTGESTYIRAEASETQYGSPSYELGVAHGMTLIDGVLGIRASAWGRYDGGWINRVDPSTGLVTEQDANYADSQNFRIAALWKPTSNLSFSPSIIYQKNQKHDEDDYWPAYSNPSAGQFNNATPERMPVPDRYWIPALKIDYNLQNSEIISNSSFYQRRELTAYQGTVYDLAYYESLGWAGNPNTGGLDCANGSAPPCSWYPLIDSTGIHMPPGFADYATPNVITNHQSTWTQEVRWQSTNDTSKWRWTGGVFWQLSKEGSIEQLNDPQINQLFNYLYGEDGYAIYGGNWYNCPTYANPYGVAPSSYIPACNIYYNANSTTDRQIAGYGEIAYAFTDTLRLTLGDRVARTSFSLQHFSNGFENYGPCPGEGCPGVSGLASQSETPNTPKVNLSYQMDNRNLFYATYAKGFRPGGGNATLPSYCDANLNQAGFPSSPNTYNADSTQSYEIGSKNSFSSNFKIATSIYYIKWSNIQQNVYIGGACGLQFTDNLGTAVAKGFDLQAELALGHFKFDIATGYTDARYTAGSFGPCEYNATLCGDPAGTQFLPLSAKGDAISGEAAIEYSPGLNPPWTASLGSEFDFKMNNHPSYVRLDVEFEARNNWLSVLQDPRTSQFNPYEGSLTVSNTYTLPSTFFATLRAGVTVNAWEVSAWIDNLLDSHTVTNYQLSQPDSYAPNPPADQQNSYTFRPRTFGLTATFKM
jgi:iron complex outermembrane recepter protein